MTKPEVHTHVRDVTDLFIKHLGGQPETRNIGAHQPTRGVQRLEDSDIVPKWTEIVGNAQRRAASADQGNFLAVLRLGRLRQTRRDVFPVISSNPFQAANSDRLVFDAPAPASWLAWAVTHATQDARKNIGFAVFDIRITETALRDESNVFGYIGVGRTGPLAIDYFVKVIGIRSISRLHLFTAAGSADAVHPLLGASITGSAGK